MKHLFKKLSFLQLIFILLCSHYSFGQMTYTVSNTSPTITTPNGLHWAIDQANNNPGVDIINFSIDGTIDMLTNTFTITEGVVIDGTTAPGYVAGTPSFILDRNSGVFINTSGTVTGLEIKGLGFTNQNANPNGSVALDLNSCSDLTITNNEFTGIGTCMDIDLGSQATITDNDFNSCGFASNRYTVEISSLTGTDPATRLTMKDNDFISCGSAIYLDGMDGLAIDPTYSAATTEVHLPAGTFDDVSRTALVINNCDNVTLDGLDLSNPTTADGVGLGIYNGDNLTIQNLTINNKRTGIEATNCNALLIQDNVIDNVLLSPVAGRGIYVSGGQDVEVLDNTLRQMGIANAQYALSVDNVADDGSGNRLIVNGNIFDGGRDAVYLANMDALTIDNVNTTTPGQGVHLPDADGRQGMNGFILNLFNMDNTSINNFDLSYTGGTVAGIGLSVNNCDNLTVTNNTIDNRSNGISGTNCNVLLVQNNEIDNVLLSTGAGRGIWISGGQNVQVIDNTLRQMGIANTQYALSVDNVADDGSGNRLIVNGNIFDGGRDAVNLSNMDALTIDNVNTTTPGQGVHLPDADGRQGMNGINLNLFNIDNTTINNFNLSYTGGTVAGQALNTNACDNLDITNNTINNRSQGIYCINNGALLIEDNVIDNVLVLNSGRGIWINGGSDVEILDNIIRQMGRATNQYALDINNVVDNGSGQRLIVNGTTFDGGANAVTLANMDGLTIDNVLTTTPGQGVHLPDSDGRQGMYNVNMFLNNIDNTTIDNFDLSYTGGTVSGQALNTSGCDNLTITNNTIDNRSHGIYCLSSTGLLVQNNEMDNVLAGNNAGRGIWINGGSDIEVLDNTIIGHGFGNNIYALDVNNVVDNGSGQRLVVNGTTFVGGGDAVSLNNMNGLIIDNVLTSSPGQGVHLPDGDGRQGMPGTNLYLQNIDDATLDNFNLSYTGGTVAGRGLYAINCDTLTISNFTINDRSNGEYLQNCTVSNVLNNTISGGNGNGIEIFLGSNYTVQGNSVSDFTSGNNNAAYKYRSIVDDGMGNRLSALDNSFSNNINGIYVGSMDDMIISDGTVADSEIILKTADNYGSDINGIRIFSSTNTQIENLAYKGDASAVAGTAIFYDLSTTSLTSGVSASHKFVGISINRNEGHVIQQSLFESNTIGMSLSTANVITNYTVANNNFNCNTEAIRANQFAVVDAANNFWGQNDGSSTDSGSGDTYTVTGNAPNTGIVNNTTTILTSENTAIPVGGRKIYNSITAQLTDGQTTTSVADSTDYETVNTGDTKTRQFRIVNSGIDSLHISSIVSSDAAFTIANAPDYILCEDSVAFDVIFAPTGATTYNSTITVTQDDCYNTDFEFAVAGVGVQQCDIAITNVSVVSESCADANDGSITVTATCDAYCNNGASDIRYSIDGTNFFDNGGVFTGLSDGTYTVTVRDVNDTNCSDSSSGHQVAAGTGPCCDIAITSATPTDEGCPGADDGEIDVVATCTTCTSIEYSIDDFTTMNTTGDFTGLADGTYTVKVRDSGDNTCTAEMMNVVVGAGVDGSGPTISCNDITVDLDAAGTYTLTSTDLEALANGSTDDCSDFSALTITSTPSTFDCDDVAGQANNLALSFDETASGNGSDYVQSTANVGITGNADRTLEFWVRMNETNLFNEHMINWGSIQQGRAFGFYQTNGAELEFYTQDSPGGWDYGTGFMFNQEEWYHVAASYDGSTNTVSVFVNGSPAPNATYTLPGAINTTDSPLILASRPDLDAATFSTIDLDEVRVWNYARTQTEIQADMNVALNGNETGLVLYYDMELDGPNTTNLVDKAGSNDATLINMDPATDWIASGSPVFSGGVPVVLEVTDAAGNTSTSTCAVTVTVNTNLTVSTSATGETCMDNDDGQIEVTVSGGTGPYTFTATRQGDGSVITLSGSSPQTFMNLIADDYIIEVEDNGGCTGTTTDNVGASATTCAPGEALDFDGVNDHVALGDLNDLLDGAGAVTIQFYLKLHSPVSNGVYSYFESLNGNSSISIESHGSKLLFYGGGVTGTVNDVLVFNQWMQITVVFDGSQAIPIDRHQIYIDGVQQELAILSPMVTTMPAILPDFFLGSQQGTSQFKDMQMDELRVWNTALDCGSIEETMNCELTGTETGLIAYYQFNEGLADLDNTGVTTLTNLASTDDGTLVNFSLNGTSSNWVAPGAVVTGSSCSPIAQPEITVNEIVQGTAFSDVVINTTSSKQYTITNDGPADLHVGAISSDNALFAIANHTDPTTIAMGMTSTFDVEFTPTALGAQMATISIVSDDCDEGTYTFDVSGTGIAACDIAITSATPTDEVCPGADDGEIDVVATCTTCTSIEYSIDDFTTMNTTGDFTGLADGTYTVKVRDSGDNTCAAELMNVVVGAGADTTDPVLVGCPTAISLELDLCNELTITAADLGITATDNCGTPTITLSQSMFTSATTTTITVTATDDAIPANTSTCDVDVTTTENPDYFTITANTDAIDACEETAITFTAASLLLNDNASNGALLQVQDVTLTNPADGTLIDNGNETYTFTSASGISGDVDLTYTVIAEGSSLYFEGTNHFYEFVPGGLTWTAAKAAAETMTLYGQSGYLATITSEAENQFIFSKLSGNGWIGANDEAVEGEWRWVTGPEAGQQFWSGDGTGSAVGGLYSKWDVLLPFIEPNGNLVTDEDYGHMIGANGASVSGVASYWNDFANDPGSAFISGYLVEYGGLESCSPDFVATGSITISLSSTPDIASISTQVNTCPSDDFDVSSMTISDNNNVAGTATTFHSAMPTSATDMANQLASTVVTADQTVFVMVANTTTGCYDVESFVVDITICCDIAITSATPTDEVCPGADDGEIDVVATCTTCTSIEYSIDDFTTMNTTGDFTGLADGTYTVKVRDSGDNTCAAELMNVVVGAGTDSSGPTISCNDITVDLDAGGTYTLTTADLEALANGSTDDCSDFSALTITSTPSTFDCDDVAGQANNLALSFDETASGNGSDYVQSTANVGITGNADRTLEFWVRMNETNLFNEHMINWGSIQQGRAFGFYQTNGAELEFYTQDSPGGWDYGTGFMFDQEEWYHVAASYDGSTNTVSVFVNGSPAPNATYTLPGAINTTDSPLILASRPDLDAATFSTIDLDEVRVWNYARTQTEIQADMNVALNGNETGLVLYYDMELDGPNTTNLVDKAGSNDATLINMDPATDWIASGSPVFSGGVPVVLEVTDAAGNTSTSTCAVTVTVNTNLTVSTSATGETCMDNDDGQIEVTVSGGTGPYTFTATRQGDGSVITLSGSSPQTFMNLIADDYIIEVEDNGGCTGTTTDNVGASTTPCCDIAITSATPTDEVCPGADDGEIDVVATCTTCTSIEYSIDDFTTMNTTGDFTGLADGTYTVKVRDSGDNTCADELMNVVVGAGADTTDPVLVGCPTAISLELDLCNELTITAADLGITATDNCGTPTITLSQSMFTSATTTTITVTATDDAIPANTSTCDVDVTTTVNPDYFEITAMDDDFDACSETAYTFTAASLLSNDNASNGATLEVQEVALVNEADGTLVDNGDDTYTFTSASGVSGDVALTYIVKADGDDLFNPDNGHFYEFIVAQDISWTVAKDAAEASVLNGVNGYLATVTSQEENDFIETKLQGHGWLGGLEVGSVTSGEWRWVTGPEAELDGGLGLQFWNGNVGGSPVGTVFSNWRTNEPNNVGTAGEQYLHMRNTPAGAEGKWNDYPITGYPGNGAERVAGYIVEYGGVAGCTPTFSATANITISINGTPDIASISTQVNTCPSDDFDVSSMTITDNNNVAGTATTFHSAMPTSATDMTNQLASTVVTADQTVFVMVANTTTGCYDVESFMVDITICCDIAITSATPTDEDCPGADDGEIDVIATCTTCTSIEYSIDDFTTMNTTGDFTGLADGTYTVKVRDSGDNTCAAELMNINVAAGVDSEAPVADDTSGPGDGWEEAAIILASDAAVGNQYGHSVSVSGDYAIVGSPGNGDGAAYIFKKAGTSWSQEAKIESTDLAAGDQFGFSVAISGDYAIAGAHNNDDAGSNSGSAYIFMRTGTTWSQQAKLLASDAAAGDAFGIIVNISGDNAIVSGLFNDDAGTNSGSAYIFKRTGTNWNEEAKIVASDAASNDGFSTSLSISGDYAIVGSYANDDAGSNSGSAYIYKRSGTNWNEEAKIVASDAASEDEFGRSVSISGDYVIVGAWLNDDAGSNSGSAYIFKRDGTNWIEEAKIVTSDAASGDGFGWSSSISGDYAIVGAWATNNSTGAAYIFKRDGMNWNEESKIVASDASSGDSFGFASSISGNNVIVGAWPANSQTGAAYIFELASGNLPDVTAECSVTPATPTATDNCTGVVNGTTTTTFPITTQGTTVVTWTYDDGNGNTTTQDQNIIIDDITDPVITCPVDITVNTDAGVCEATNVALGTPTVTDNCNMSIVATNDAPTTFPVGMTTVLWTADDGNGQTATCTQTVLVVDNEAPVIDNVQLIGSWEEAAKVLASNSQADEYFGYSVSILNDWAIVGARGDDTGAVNAGAAYIFKKVNGSWLQQQKITPSNPVAQRGFGWSVNMAENYLIVGMPWQSPSPGYAYIFIRNGNTWSQQAILQASDGQAADQFGWSVSMNDTQAMVGAYGEDTGGDHAGSTYTFERSGTTWTQTQKLQPSDIEAGDGFGVSVSLSGNQAIIGSLWENTGGNHAGSAYIYNYVNGTWVEDSKIQASDVTAGAEFGISVSMSGDNAIVGTRYFGIQSMGGAYIFEKVGGSWIEQIKLQGSDTSAGDEFGSSVSIDGNQAIVAARYENEGGNHSGAGYIFMKQNGSWGEIEKIVASDAQSEDEFGYAAAISSGSALVGAHLEDTGGVSAGAAYFYDFTPEYSLTAFSGECSATPNTPTAVDNCAGMISGTTSTNFPLTEVGDSIVTWTFDDGNGNTITATQLVTLSGVTYYADTDNDGFGDPNNTIQACPSAPNGYVVDNTDCDDSDPDEFPGQTWYIDGDGDLYGGSSVVACNRPTDGFLLSELAAGSTGDDDCDDALASVNPGAGDVPDGLDNDCDGAIDEVPLAKWVALDGNDPGTCVDATDDCAQTYCFGLEYNPGSNGVLTSYTTGFTLDCSDGNNSVISNVSCVMDDNSGELVDCGNGGVLMNSSGVNGSLAILVNQPVILHTICLDVLDNESLTLMEDAITDISMAIDLTTSGIITEFPEYTDTTVNGNTPPVLTAGTIDACYTTAADAEAAAIAATTGMDDYSATVTYTASTVGTCTAVVTVVGSDDCGLTSEVTYSTKVDGEGPNAPGTLVSTLDGCSAADAPAAVTTVMDLLNISALINTVTVSDDCTANADITVSHVDEVASGCPINITRTYTLTDECGNSSEVIHFISINDEDAPSISGDLDDITVDGCSAADAPAAETTVAGLEALAGTLSIEDICTADADLVVGSSDVVSGIEVIVITRTYTVMDLCENISTFDQVITVNAPDNIMEMGGPALTSNTMQSALYETGPPALPTIVDGCGRVLDPVGPTIGGTYTDGDCEGTITYTYTYTDSAGRMFDWVYINFIDCAGLNIRVYTEGSYSMDGDSLGATLNELHVLPGQDKLLSSSFGIQIGAPFTPFGQPYQDAPWNFVGHLGDSYGDASAPNAPTVTIPYPSHVVDWILVTVRENGILPADDIFTCAGWLHTNGEVTFPETCPDALNLASGNDYYIVVEHRNHLPVLDTAAIMGSSDYLELDFTSSNSYAPIFRSGQKEMSPGVWGMFSSNIDQVLSRTSINSADQTGWKLDQNGLGYNYGDVDMSGAANSSDETKWKVNQNKTSGVRFN